MIIIKTMSDIERLELEQVIAPALAEHYVGKISSQASWTQLERTRFIAHQVIIATMMVLDGETDLTVDSIGSYAFHMRDNGINQDIAAKMTKLTEYLGEVPMNEKDAKKIYRTTGNINPQRSQLTFHKSNLFVSFDNLIVKNVPPF